MLPQLAMMSQPAGFVVSQAAYMPPQALAPVLPGPPPPPLQHHYSDQLTTLSEPVVSASKAKRNPFSTFSAKKAGGGIFTRARRHSKDMLSFGGPAVDNSVPTMNSAATLTSIDYSSSEDTTESIPDTPRQKAYGLIALQTFEGSFPLTSALAAILGVRLRDLEAKLAQFIPITSSALQVEKRRLWATVLAVRMFEGRLKGEKEMWELVVEKAREWMAALGTDDNVKRLEALAGEVVKA